MIESPLEAIYNYLRFSDRVATAGQPTAEQFRSIRDAGFQTIVNLLPPSQLLSGEEDLVRELGMEFISIPVWWNAPEICDINRFFEVMEATCERRVFVHCAANMRATVFMYLYRVQRERVPTAEAEEEMHRVWTPNPIWQRFIERVAARDEEERLREVKA